MNSSGIDMPEWHIVTCEYPPTIGGISDYALAVATALGAAGHQVHVWCPSAEGTPPERDGVTVHREFGRFDLLSLWRSGRLLNQFPPRRRLFVQWVPQGFGYRSLNLPFAAWLTCRAWLRGDEIHLMIHEPYLGFSTNALHTAASLVHRAMLFVAGLSADRIWLSTQAWVPFVRPYLPRRRPMQWMPVTVPAVPRAGDRDTAMVRDRLAPAGTPLVGHFSSHSTVLTPVLAPAIEWVLQHSGAIVALIGRNGDRLRTGILSARPDLAGRIVATGDVDSAAVPAHVQACDVMLQPYPEGITARRTSTLTLLALGCPVVTNNGALTEGFWRQGDLALAPGPDPAAIGALVVELLEDAPRRAELGERGLGVYSRLFDVQHAVAVLQHASALPITCAAEPLARRSVNL